MKKFFSAIPLQRAGQLNPFHYRAVGNPRLEMEGSTCFPILTAVNGYVEQGEEFRVIAVMTDNPDGCRNCEALQKELAALCEARGFRCPRGVEIIPVPPDEQVATHVGTFQTLIDRVEDEDDLYACMTFGTKPLSTVLQMAMLYAYRVKRNASISCVVYGQITRGDAGSSAAVYDMTALVQLDELVRVLADRGVQNPKEVLASILNL